MVRYSTQGARPLPPTPIEIPPMIKMSQKRQFCERNAIARDGFNIWHSARGHAIRWDFFGLHLYLAEKYCKNPKVPGAQLNVNPARAATRFVGVTIY